MKEKIIAFNDKAKSFWHNRSKSQRGIFIGSIAILVLLVVTIILFVSNPSFTPLYNKLSVQEVSQIKDELEARNIPYKIKDGGTTIEVPEEKVSGLLVDLAGQGIPNSGNIDYSFFSENTSWGVTDNEFNIMKLDAMQTELANLIQNIKGINNADVMINIPEDPLFVSESMGEASASVVIHTDPGYEFRGNQIDSLYHLVSKAVPNLPEDNIVIMNQYFEYYDQSALANGYDGSETYTYQQEVKQDIERDIQRRLQQMLGTMVGRDQVIVSVTADIDFTQENRTEELVEPIDVENIEGLPVSIEKIRETYSGNPPAGGDVGMGEGDTTESYQGIDGNDNGEYELDKETINNEFNRIQREIVESPYKIRDLGIQVAVDNVKERNGSDITYLSVPDQEAVEAGISSILDSIITSSIDKEYGEVDPEEKTSIVFQEFSEQPKAPQTASPVISLWMYIAGGILLILIIVLIVLLMRSRKQDDFYEETFIDEQSEEAPSYSEDEDSEEVKRRKQLEKMAKDKPEDFAKLLRSWISEE